MSETETPNKKRSSYEVAKPAREPTETEALTAAYTANVEVLLRKANRISELQAEEISIRNQIVELKREADKLREAQRTIHTKLDQLTK